MPHESIVVDVARFLDRLETTQEALLELYGLERTALTRARSRELLELAEREAGLGRELEEILRERRGILRRGQADGLPSGSIAALVTALTGGRESVLTDRVAQARSRTETLRRESWIHWIIAQRAYNHCSTVIDLIAHRGERPVTYTQGASDGGSGGAILDASA